MTETKVQHRSIETRSQIKQAALECFALHGFDAAGVAEICAKADVSKGAFYHHFPSKHAVFMALLEDWLTILDEQLNLAMQSAGSVPEALVGMTDLLTGVYQEAGGMLAMFLEFWSHSARDEEVWKAVVAPYRRYEDLFAGYIRRGIQEGSLKPMDDHNAARIIVAFAVGILLQGLLDPGSAQWDRVAHEGMESIMEGMKARRLK